MVTIKVPQSLGSSTTGASTAGSVTLMAGSVTSTAGSVTLIAGSVVVMAGSVVVMAGSVVVMADSVAKTATGLISNKLASINNFFIKSPLFPFVAIDATQGCIYLNGIDKFHIEFSVIGKF